MLGRFVVITCLMVLAGCSGPKDTPLPRELEKMESIKSAMEKLPPEERQLVTGYIVRHTIGAKLGGLFGGKEGPGIPEGMTLGKAIDEQTKFQADAAIEEAKQKALKEKLKAESEAAMSKLRGVITVTLVSKKLEVDRGYGGMVMDERISVTIGYKNNTEKDVAGVKGHLAIKDIFGEDLSGFQVSNDSTIKAGGTITWQGGRSVKYGMNRDNDRKFAELTEDKYKVVWEPSMVVFADGTKLTVPEH